MRLESDSSFPLSTAARRSPPFPAIPHHSLRLAMNDCARPTLSQLLQLTIHHTPPLASQRVASLSP